MDYKVLFIDDDKDLSFIISETVSKYGYNVVLAYSEEMAYEILEKKKFDVIILDINLPDSSGFKICNEIRKNSQVPIIFASARSSVSDRIDSLNLGGDFYLSKPYSIKELIAALNAILRRCHNGIDSTTSFGQIKINIDSRQVFKNDKPIQLSLKEFDLLLYMINNKNKALNKDTILAEVWGTFSSVELQTLTVHIRWLREKLEDNPAEPKYIKTIRGVGYMLDLGGK